MNYAGKFEAFFSQGQGAAAPAHVVHGDQVHAHAPADAIVVPDAHLLFNGDFKRSGVDLILSEGEREFVLHDYFKGEKRAALASPDGAHLTGDLVNALAGSVQVGQAGGGASGGQVIGHVTKLAGNATVVRNGVSIILHMGDNVEKGDVVQSGSDSTIGITFMDGTVFGLSSNARMVLNEMVYDPNGSSNSTLFSLVAGTISFVAGETAKHGDMKIDTPVATMGIRGTAVLVEIDFSVPGQNGTPNAKFQVLVEPDGTTGSYILFDKTTLQPIAVVNQAGQQVNITNGVVSQTQNPLSPELQKLINDVFSQKFTDNTNPNPKTNFAQNDSITPFSGPPIKLADGTTATPLFVNLNSPSHQDSPTANALPDVAPRIPGPPQAVILDANGNPTTNFTITERVGHTGDGADLDGVIGSVNYVDGNSGDVPSVSVSFSGATYHGHASPGATALADIAAAEVKISVLQDGGNRNFGTATFTYSIPDKAFDFLANGETLTLTYTVTVDNNFPADHEAASQTFTITITGTNDAPVIATAVQTIAFSGGTKTPGGPLVTDNPTSGMLAFTDVDLTDTHKVAAALKAVTLDGKAFDLADLEPTPFKILNAALSAKLATDSTGTGTGSVTWTLADLPAYVADFIPKGETLTLTYEVTVTDSQGATATRDVTVTITGTEPPAEVWISTGAEGQDHDWNNGTNWETGNKPTSHDDAIVITDQLHHLTPSFPVTIDTQAFAKSLTMNDFGTTPPTVINESTGTLVLGDASNPEDPGGALTLQADSVLQNFGTIHVGGQALVADQSVIQNDGTLDFASGLTLDGVAKQDAKGKVIQGPASITNNADGTIDVSGELDIKDQGVLLNYGTMTLGDIAKVLGQSALTNTGTLTLANGGDFGDQSSITNSGTIEIKGGTLNVSVDVANSITNSGDDDEDPVTTPGTIRVDTGAALVLSSGGGIDGGTVCIDGTLELAGTSSLTQGMLDVASSGIVTVDGDAVAAFDGETVGNSGLIDIVGSLTLALGATISNLISTAKVSVEAGAKLTLNGATIDQGTVTNTSGGEIDLAGNAVVKDGALGNAGTIKVSGAGNALHHETVTANNALEVTSHGALLLDLGTTITNGGTVTVDSAATLTLKGATIDGGGTVANNDGGELDLGGSGVIANGVLTNSGAINASGSGNALDHEQVTNGGTIEIGGTLTLDLGTALTNSVSTNTIMVDESGTLIVNFASIDGGTIVNNGALDLTGSSVVKNGSLGNAGTIKVSGTGNALHHETITANHMLEVMAGAALLIDTGSAVANGGGTVTVDGTGTLTLDTATIGGGTINDYSVDAYTHAIVAGEIDVTGASTINDNATLNKGGVTVEHDVTLTLDNVTVNGTAFHDTAKGAAIAVDENKTLTLQNGATVSGGDLIVSGTLHIETASGAQLDGVAVSGGGTIVVDDAVGAGTLLLDDGASITGGTLTIGAVGTVDVETGVALHGVHVGNGHVIDIGMTTAAVLTLDGGTTVTGGDLSFGDSYDQLVVEKGAQDLGATLDGVTVSGGGAIHVGLDTSGAVLTLDDDTGITGGALTVGEGSMLEIATGAYGTGATLDGVCVDNSGTLQVDDGATLALDGGRITGGALTISGTLDTTGCVVIDSTMNNSGVIEVKSGTLDLYGGLSGSGQVIIDAGAKFELDGSDSQLVTFNGHGAELRIDTATFDGQITGLIATDKIDLGSIQYDLSTTTATYCDGVLTVTDAKGDRISLALSGDYSNLHFVGSSDGHGGTLITLSNSDAAPILATTQQTASVSEAPGVTGSPALDPQPPASGSISFTDVDLTDRPTATISAQKLVWTDVDHSTELPLSLSPDQISAIEHGLQLVPVSNANSGKIDWTYSVADSALDFLRDGQTLTIDSTIMLDDYKGGSDTAHVVITVTGSNDKPVVTALSDAVHEGDPAFSRDLLGGATDADTGETATLQVSHVRYAVDGGDSSETPPTGLSLDADGHTLHVDPSNPAFNHLAEGESTTITVSYDVVDVHGASVPQTETIIVTGTNDAPTVTAALHDHANEGDSAFTKDLLSGASDVDDGDTLHVSDLSYKVGDGTALQTPPTGVSLGADGHTLHVDPADPAFAHLGQGQSTTITVSYDVTDQHGASVPQTETITIDGINNKPVVTSAAQTGNVNEQPNVTGSPTPDVAYGTITFTDADQTDTHIVTVTGVSVSDQIPGLPDAATIKSWLSLGTLTDGTSASQPWTFSAPDHYFDQLAANQTLKLDYSVQIDDGHGGVVTTPVTITVTGASEPSPTTTREVHGDDSHAPPVIDTTQILLTQTGNKTTVSGVHVMDADPAASSEIYSYSETALHGTLSGPTTGSGNLQQINTALGSITENSQNNSGIDKVTLTVHDSFDNSDTVNFVFSVGGNPGEKAAALTGGDGKDVIIASGHDDQMTGGPGADQFVFAPTKSDNADTITDFTHGQDRLDLRAFSDLVDTQSLSDQWIKDHASVVGHDTLITLNLPGPGHHTDTILLQHVTSALQVGDFIVSPHHAAGSA